MKFKITHWLFAFSFAIFVFGSGYKLGEYKATKKAYNIPTYRVNKSNDLIITNQKENIDFSLFWETWDKVTEKFIDKGKVDSKKMFYGAIKGMVASLEDPYTFFLTPEENKQSKDDLGGKFEGIGAQLGLKGGRITVIAPLKSSPAEKAGVKAGDFIAEVDGQSTRSWTLPQAVSKIRGAKGTKVKLALERDGKRIAVTIVRDQIKVPSIELSIEKNSNCQKDCQKVAYMKISQFGENTNSEWDKAVAEVRNKLDKGEIKGLVLDLRDNPGGFLDGAVYLASDFLPVGKPIVKQETTTGQDRQYYALKKGKLLDIKTTIIINKGSASASEILAGALRDHKRAVLVGEKSFGKGSVQEALDLNEGAGLHVTVAKWILPNGSWINGKGIEPSIKLENQSTQGETLTRKDDKQLDRAIEEVLK